jgi:signal peptidase I
MAEPTLTQPFPPPEEQKPPSRWGRAVLAGFLSLLLPGTGQLYNRQPRKALGMALTFPLLTLVMVTTRVFFSFWSFVLFNGIVIAWRLVIAAEAAYSAKTEKKAEPAIPQPRVSYALLVVAIVSIEIFPTSDQLIRWTGFGAFVVPSASMCPTICKGERIVADRKAYKNKAPQRGDIVLVKHQMFDELLIKRVVGVPGDLVEAGPDNTILVNGSPLRSPEVCQLNLREHDLPGNGPAFHSIGIPKGTLFLVGDNLGNSLDSRFPEFGLASFDEIRGKPLFLAWSPKLSRIGCPVR